MYNYMLKAKLHMICVTDSELNYEGSCAIDGDFLDKTGLREYEQIQIYNKDNGERFTTYIIRAENDTKQLTMNGAAARKVSVGDKLIICAYSSYSDQEMMDYKPSIIYFNTDNSINHMANAIPIQMYR